MGRAAQRRAFRGCVATGLFQRNGTVESEPNQPRSGGIAVSPGRKPWVKCEMGRAAQRRAFRDCVATGSSSGIERSNRNQTSRAGEGLPRLCCHRIFQRNGTLESEQNQPRRGTAFRGCVATGLFQRNGTLESEQNQPRRGTAFRGCVATGLFQRNGTLESEQNQPRSGGIAVSPGRKPWVKCEMGRAAERRHRSRYSFFRLSVVT